ncbi:hypothetical protein H0H81_005873 [Sphagnurus paluster]|uniref:tRNA (guanine(9)-N1)-methyltransferase n=1 Tax=Sphagnurus paluster TaxID=117069 RepID=A0A9P7K882_9AGAR|nr:hypothetical protein H0H81_005873 [Sphagnurus paluster]
MDDVKAPVDVVETVEPVAGPSESDPPAAPLSKSAIKKAAKAERIAASKLERRAREKEAKKDKKRALAAKRAAGELDEDEERKRSKKRARLQFGGTVVVDLGFDDKMNDKEIISLSSQLAYTYSANRNASYPFSLVYTSLNGRTMERLESMNDAGYKRWSNTQWWQEGYERLWQGQPAPADTNAEETAGALGPPPTQTDIQKSVVYLTADSEDELTELRPEEIYIIGGICDHNRYKNLCLNKAKESGIRTARLPIGRYLAALPTRKVLTVNQVFEILLKWVETQDWEAAFHSVIPRRKFQVGGKGAGSGTATAKSQAGEAEAVDAVEDEGAKIVVEEASVAGVEEQEQEYPGDDGDR